MALSTQRASTSLTSAEWAPSRWKHDVFLSFRGEDTRRGFISHLDRALAYWQAMRTFKDDRELEVGATITLELLTAIKESYLAIIVLSPNYASSTWCLNELSEILECMEDTKRILPIFYDVDPSDVRNQKGSFAEAFTRHEERFSGDAEKLNRWRDALTKVANLTGLDSKTYKSEAELVDDIVKRVWKKVNPTVTLLDSQEKLVGIDSALDQLHLHLAPEENDVRFIGIWGIGGVGKTTLANLVYERISHHFEHCCFLHNVRKKELSDLQRQLLSPLLKGNHIWDEREGTVFINKVLWNKKVLLVLDDVDQLHQLEVLARDKILFGVGSRIIITTRDKRLLVQHGTTTFKVEVLKNDEALELFSRHAFKKDQPEKGFQELSQHFLYYANGLPLALKILGRALYGREQDVWKSALYNLNKIPDPDIFDSLKVSYYGLKEMEKKIFRHVACFHRGKNKEQVIHILDGSLNISSLIQIDILIEKSLLTIEKLHFRSNIVEMHDLIQEMAREIVRQESIQEPGQRSLLWHRDDISHVIMNNTGTGAIEAIGLHLPKLEEVHWNCTEAFSKMHGLRLLEFDNVIVSSAPKDLPNSLRTISWSWYPSKSLPSSFEPRFLVQLRMGHSKLVQLWDGAKVLPNLKYMDLNYSDKLTSTPDFTGIPNLESLWLHHCTNLVEVHSSFAVHKKLKDLQLIECPIINNLPSEVEMDSLERFILFGCPKVKNIRRFVEQLNDKMDSLCLHGIAIEQIRPSIEHLVGLKHLTLEGCTKINKMAVSSLNRFTSLEKLDLSFCNIGEGDILDDIGCLSSLKYLSLFGNDFVSLPSSIRFLSKLVSLGLKGCKRLERLPDLPPNINRLDVSDCISLKRLPDPSRPGANLYDFLRLSCLNCFKLVEEKDWINAIFQMIRTAAIEGMLLKNNGKRIIVCPIFGILEWFGYPSVGDSVTVELPLPPHPSNSSDWVGIAFCVVFDDSEYFDSPASLLGYEDFEIKVRSSQRYLDFSPYYFEAGNLVSEHLWVFYLPSDHPSLTDASTSHRFSFETYYSSTIDSGLEELKTSSIIKECRARLVYKRDLEEFSRLLYGDGAGPIGSGGSGSSDEDDEPVGKRWKKV